MAGHAQLKLVMTECSKTQIRLTRPISYLRFMLQHYKDQQLCDFLEFGFPIGYNGNNEILQQINKKDVWKF